MDKVVGYFADIVEFLVAGVVVGAAALLALWSIDSSTISWIPSRLALISDDMGTALSLVALAVVYALGVFAEGASRLLTEWRLRQMTEERFSWVLRRRARATQKRNRNAVTDESAVAESAVATKAPATTAQPASEEGPARGFVRRITRPRLTAAEEDREHRRSELKHVNPAGAQEVADQLKRLRIERTLLLALPLVTLAVAFSNKRWWAAVPLLLTLAAAWLVNERFHRFLEAIERGHETAPHAPVPAHGDGGGL